MFWSWPAADSPGDVGLAAADNYFRPDVPFTRIVFNNINCNGSFGYCRLFCLREI